MVLVGGTKEGGLGLAISHPPSTKKIKTKNNFFFEKKIGS